MIRYVWVLVCVVQFHAVASDKAEVQFTILQTGDLHGHFLPHRHGPYTLGGYARLKTKLDQLRENLPNVLYFDSGDFSEGSIFFNLDRARPTLKMLDHLGAEATVLGNHDWFRGPTFVEEWLRETKVSFPILSSNLLYTGETRGLNKYIPTWEEYKKNKGNAPWIILEREGVKIGVFGLSTAELFYQYLFAPVTIASPIEVARELVPVLRPQVDILIAVTHLEDKDDLSLAANVSGIDFILGGHSHNKFTSAKTIYNKKWTDFIGRIEKDLENKELSKIERMFLEKKLQKAYLLKAKHKTYVMKTGEHGRDLGQLDVRFNRETREVTLGKTSLVSIDPTIPEDTSLKELINHYMRDLERDFKGPIFSDRAFHTHIDLEKIEFAESRLGNLMADIVFEKTRKKINEINEAIRNSGEARSISDVDFAVTNSSFLSHGFYKGTVHTADIYDAMCKIYDHDKNTNWHLFVVEILGKDLQLVLNAFMSFTDHYLNLSNAELVYSDTFFGGRFIQDMKVGDQPFDPERVYHFVTEQGVVDALMLIKENLLSDLEYWTTDLGVNYWEALREGFMVKSPITLNNTDLSGRMRSSYADLAVYSPDIEISHLDEDTLSLKAGIFNLGNSSSTANLKVTFYYDATPLQVEDNPDYYKPPKLTEIKIPDTLKVISSVRLEQALPGISKTEVKVVWDMGSDVGVRFVPIYVKIGPFNEKESYDKNDNLANNIALTYYEKPAMDFLGVRHK